MNKHTENRLYKALKCLVATEVLTCHIDGLHGATEPA